MESRMCGNTQVRFGGRDGRNPAGQPAEGAPVPTLRDTTPSRADLDVTRKISQAGRLLGIELLDHLIVGAEGFTSLRECHGSLLAT